MWFCCLLLHKRSMTKASAWQHVFQTISNTSKGGMLTSRRRGLVEPVLFIIVRLLRRDGWIEKNEAGCSRPKDFAPARRPAGRPAFRARQTCLAPIFHFFERSFSPVPSPPPTATMSAALKDGIKSAMSGVGVALSGDMLSKCEFRGLLLYLSTKILKSKSLPIHWSWRTSHTRHLGTGEERWPS